jgi:hypothetical protein
MFGVAAHIYADIPWHWGRKVAYISDFQGFLRAMAHSGSRCKDQWNNNWQLPSCHTFGDVGEDIYLGIRYADSGIYDDKWSFPSKDIHQVY